MVDEEVLTSSTTCFNGYWLCAEVPDQESDEELEGSDLDIALPAFMGESRAQLMRSQETLRGQLAAEVCTDVHSETCQWATTILRSPSSCLSSVVAAMPRQYESACRALRVVSVHSAARSAWQLAEIACFLGGGPALKSQPHWPCSARGIGTMILCTRAVAGKRVHRDAVAGSRYRGRQCTSRCKS